MRTIMGLVAGMLAPTLLAGDAEAQQRGPRSCTAGIRSAIDTASFSGMGGASAARLEDLRRRADQRFRAVADSLCVLGELRPAALRPFRRLLIQYGGGASETAVYVQGGDTLIFQQAFEPGRGGRFAVPEAADVRDGIRCWSAPARHRRMCADRLP